MSDFLQIQYGHVSDYETQVLLKFNDDWCNSITDEKRQKESQLARLLLDKICRNTLKRTIKKAGFKKDYLGRPFFENYPNLFISITHSDGYVFVAVSNSAVGIDFEKIDLDSSEDLKIAFNDTDWKIVSNDVNSLFKYFSLKESYSKMIGTGFTSEPANIQIESLEMNCHSVFFENNDLKYIFTIITSHFEPKKFLNSQFNSLHLK
jgi:phosphopantetheinyl transferase